MVALKRTLAALAWFNLISALAGMIGLTLGGGFGMPNEWIEQTAFGSFVWPGVILGVIVGGSQALALLAQYGRYRVAWGLHAAAGLIMIIWIVVELAVILLWSPLQGVYFATGLVQTVLAVLVLGAWPSPFFARTARSTNRHRESLHAPQS